MDILSNSFERVSIHGNGAKRQQYPTGSSPDSVLDSSAHTQLSRSPSPDIIFRRGRTCNDPDIMRNPLRIINSDVFKFLENGRIDGPAGCNSGYVHDYDEVRPADSGRRNRRIISAQWGDFIRPVSMTKNALEFTPFTRARLQMSPNRNYVDDPIDSTKRPARFTQFQLKLKDTTFQPDIMLHGKVKYPDLEYKRDGPGGTDDYEWRPLTKNFYVRVPLEYAIRRPIGFSTKANSPR